jgi:uncharacterized protein (TIGR00375 family)
MKFLADLHVHSRFSRATSKSLDLAALYAAARWKGISVVATGDCLHPAWLDAIEAELEPAEPGLFRLRADRVAAVSGDLPPGEPKPVRFVLETEISNIYKKEGATRKNHNLVYLPDTAAARRLHARLDAIGNLDSDGRPILGLDARDLLEITLDVCPDAFLVPAHAWTPWFSLFGSKSGFDRLADCFEDLSGEIFAVETGLSSDPPMNWRISELDSRTLISNSDAHSTATLGRNANRFDAEFSFSGIRDALRSRDPGRCLGTIDLHPEEGKYHLDGHRACGVWMHPAETRSRDGICPECGKPLTVGVLHRVAVLADRPEGHRPAGALPFRHIVPLPEILSELLNVGPRSKAVDRRYRGMIEKLGPELPLLLEASLSDVESAEGPEMAEAIRRMRAEDVRITPGFDGQYGHVRLFDPAERPKAAGQRSLFSGTGGAGESPKSRSPRSGREKSGSSATAVSNSKSERLPSRPSAATPKANAEPTVNPPSAPVDGVLHSQVAEGPRFPSVSESSHPSNLFNEQMDSPDSRGRNSRSRNFTPPESDSTDILGGLNEAQREAVTHGHGPLIIVAGPGSGKTRTLTRRAAWLIREAAVPPQSILAITFTQRAAREMRERIAALLGPEAPERPNATTFHAFGLEFLIAEEVFPGALLDESSREELIRDARKSVGFKKLSVSSLSSAIGLAKARLLRPSDDLSALAEPGKRDEFRAGYAAYQARLEVEGAMDFDDLILETVDRLDRVPEVRDRWRERIRHLLVDEYQDINEAQYRLVRLLSPEGGGLFVIGDPDQAIYGFRGADHRFFARFAEDYPGARQVRLERNYRSTETILSASRQMLRDRFPGTAPVHSGISGAPRLSVLARATERAEAVAIGKTIEEMTGGAGFQTVDFGKAGPDGHRSFGDVAVLFRSHAAGRLIREILTGAGIPCQTADRQTGLAHPVLTPILAALRLLEGIGISADLPAAASLLAPLPAAAARPGALLRAIAQARGQGLRPREALAAAASGASDAAPAPLVPVSRALEMVRAETQDESARETLERLLARLPKRPTGSAESAVEKAKRTAEAYGRDRTGFLRAVALHADPDELEVRAERVSLLTLHAAKGLEFPVVFIAGCEDGLIPFRRAGGDPVDLAEERRLLYVGATRAREELILAYAKRRTRFGRTAETAPSPFLRDVESNLLQFLAPSPSPAKPARREQLVLFGAGGEPT